MSSGNVGSGYKIGQQPGQRLEKSDSGSPLKRSSKVSKEDGERLVSGAGFVAGQQHVGHVPVVLRRKKRNDFLPLDPSDEEAVPEESNVVALESSRSLLSDTHAAFGELRRAASETTPLHTLCVGVLSHDDEAGVAQLNSLARKPTLDAGVLRRVSFQATKLGLPQDAGAGRVALVAAAKAGGFLGGQGVVSEEALLAALQSMIRNAGDVLGQEAEQSRMIGVQNHRLQTFVRK
jgi:hypothetical protein